MKKYLFLLCLFLQIDFRMVGFWICNGKNAICNSSVTVNVTLETLDFIGCNGCNGYYTTSL